MKNKKESEELRFAIIEQIKAFREDVNTVDVIAILDEIISTFIAASTDAEGKEFDHYVEGAIEIIKSHIYTQKAALSKTIW